MVQPLARRVFFGAAHLWAVVGALLAMLYFFLGPRQNRLERNSVLNSTRELRYLRLRAKRALLAACPHETIYWLKRNKKIRVFDSNPSASQDVPTVIMPAEDGETAALWGFVAAQLIGNVRVIAYHRQSSSDDSDDRLKRRNILSRYSDLREVVNRKRISGDIIIVSQDESSWSSLLYGATAAENNTANQNPRRSSIFGGNITPNILGVVCVTPRYYPPNRTIRFWEAVKKNSQRTHREGMEREWSKAAYVDTTGEVTKVFEKNIQGADKSIKTFAKFFGGSSTNQTFNYGDQFVDDAYSRMPALSQLEDEFLQEHLPSIRFPVHVLIPHPETMPYDFGREKQELLALLLFQSANVVGNKMDPRGGIKHTLNQQHSETKKSISHLSEDGSKRSETKEGNTLKLPSQNLWRWVSLRLGGASIESLYPWKHVAENVRQIQAPYFPTLIHNVTGNMYSIPLQAPQGIVKHVERLLTNDRNKEVERAPVYASLWGWWPPLKQPKAISPDEKPKTLFRDILL